MPTNKSPGPDKISMRVIKDCLPVILGPLTTIINCSLAKSTFPDAWKNAEIIPFLKEGNHEVALNNRPLSLRAVASKVCERVALDQFGSYLLKNKHLPNHQSGNNKNHSTETLNILVSDAILEAMDKKSLTALILLDLSKAFDSINHSILLRKLSEVGASTATASWFKSYLAGRTQTVRIGSTLSSPLPITHGVPQGAILSPLLCCIYLRDLPMTPQTCCLESYVDDTKVFLSFSINELGTATTKLEQTSKESPIGAVKNTYWSTLTRPNSWWSERDNWCKECPRTCPSRFWARHWFPWPQQRTYNPGQNVLTHGLILSAREIRQNRRENIDFFGS